ncbi:hypothetical protein GIB67_012042 [Kingdonia uniflora]|uniref:Aminotransferase-like plant mobile domain-containing protein n=1 Tax=Kingdonia uniflora TaxID=39325 RepID=A0A7J7M085_9MAGN|nr:hypothetical protein GIB67_012042 [Kingdonia uniflora]
MIQDFVKLKGLDRIGAISYNFYNSELISAFAECWQPETNIFYFKWGEMTQTLDDVERLVGLPADGDATVIGGTWGFLVLREVFQNNLMQDLNAFKSLKAGGAGNSLSLKKLKEYYAYKLEKVLSDGTATTAKKKKGLTASLVADDDVRIHQWKEASVNEHGDTPVHQSEDVVEQYDALHHEHASLSSNAHDTMPIRGESGAFDQQITTLNDQLQKLKEDKEESEANVNLREALKEKVSYTYLYPA